MKRIIAIIQARMGSKRLAGKMMLTLHGYPIIEWVVRRVSFSNRLDDVVVAIPDTKIDDILDEFIRKKLKTKVYRGSENDVLCRFVEAGNKYDATHVVRVCADNPLVSGEVIDELITFYEQNCCDYAYNQGDGGRTNTYPDGFGAEIVPFYILEWLNIYATSNHHREHCLSFINENPDKFTLKTFNPSDQTISKPCLKFDMDTLEDYRNLSLRTYSIDSSLHDIIRAFEE
jgi:spore coat polysaccharide biosynthesis protein SpsF